MNKHFFPTRHALLGRSLRHILRSPDTIITTAINADRHVVDVRLRLRRQRSTPAAVKYVDYLLPGILLITVASGVAYTALRLFTDVSSGILRAVPVDADRPFGGPVGARVDLVDRQPDLARVGRPRRRGDRVPLGSRHLIGSAVLGIIVLFTLALTWLAVVPGLVAKSPDGAGAFAYPLLFLPFVSSAFVPTTGMPGPVKAFAEHQPVTSIVNTLRNLYAANRSATTCGPRSAGASACWSWLTRWPRAHTTASSPEPPGTLSSMNSGPRC